MDSKTLIEIDWNSTECVSLFNVRGWVFFCGNFTFPQAAIVMAFGIWDYGHILNVGSEMKEARWHFSCIRQSKVDCACMYTKFHLIPIIRNRTDRYIVELKTLWITLKKLFLRSFSLPLWLHILHKIYVLLRTEQHCVSCWRISFPIRSNRLAFVFVVLFHLCAPASATFCTECNAINISFLE